MFLPLADDKSTLEYGKNKQREAQAYAQAQGLERQIAGKKPHFMVNVGNALINSPYAK